MKFYSWNVNGLRACIDKGFWDFFGQTDADFFCLQEIKMQEYQKEFDISGYEVFWNSAQKKGYSGTLIFAKTAPIGVERGIFGRHTDEGRVIALEYPRFFLVNCYSPNAQDQLARLDYRMQFEDDLRAYLLQLAQTKPVVLCGDLNVAHQEIDLKNPKPNMGSAGFSDEERAKFGELLAAGFVDSYRFLYPDKKDAYTWWSYRFGARKRNAGWRIDYFLVSQGAADAIDDSVIHADVDGSDHCPVELKLAIE
jgi:exodeoxyribonuclease-3